MRIRAGRKSCVGALVQDARPLGLGSIHPARQYQRRVPEVDEGNIAASLDTPAMPQFGRKIGLTAG